ncbi:MAG: hypothetical protein E6G04_10770 [Actinobacteria bacterium]|nr:MAG: hypothetical protein E6G04_10770 [Actinomycetota bacterium]
MAQRTNQMLAASLAAFAGIVHAIKVPDHFTIATWLGVLFVMDAIGLVLMAVWLLVRPSRLAAGAAGLLAIGTAGGYVISRTVGLPSVGRLPWDTIGIVVTVGELALALVCLPMLATRRSMAASEDVRRAA